MNTSGSSLHKRYRGMSFWFCSEQCEKRFESRPQLYVGDPWHGQSVKQQGSESIKSRKLHLNEVLKPLIAKLLCEELEKMMGVKVARLDGQTLVLTYDLIQVSLKEIETKVEECYGDLTKKPMETLRRALIHDSEECELDSLAHLSIENPWKPGT
jgi:YHS domain-containing protein